MSFSTFKQDILEINDVADATTPKSIDEELALLKTTKESIKQAIISKGISITSPTDDFASYSGKINSLEVKLPTYTDATVVTPGKVETILPTAGKSVNSNITVNAVTSAVDANIQAGNIKKGIEILGVVGAMETCTQEDIDALLNPIAVKLDAINGGV